MDPVTLAALIKGGSQVLGQAMAPVPSGPSSAYGGSDGQAYNSSPYDGSNWTVSTGSSTSKGGGTSGGNGNTGVGIPTEYLLIAAAVVAVLVFKKAR